jgi:hypothetical protein
VGTITIPKCHLARFCTVGRGLPLHCGVGSCYRLAKDFWRFSPRLCTHRNLHCCGLLFTSRGDGHTIRRTPTRVLGGEGAWPGATSPATCLAVTWTHPHLNITVISGVPNFCGHDKISEPCRLTGTLGTSQRRTRLFEAGLLWQGTHNERESCRRLRFDRATP